MERSPKTKFRIERYTTKVANCKEFWHRSDQHFGGRHSENGNGFNPESIKNEKSLDTQLFIQKISYDHFGSMT